MHCPPAHAPCSTTARAPHLHFIHRLVRVAVLEDQLHVRVHLLVSQRQVVAADELHSENALHGVVNTANLRAACGTHQALRRLLPGAGAHSGWVLQAAGAWCGAPATHWKRCTTAGLRCPLRHVCLSTACVPAARGAHTACLLTFLFCGCRSTLGLGWPWSSNSTTSAPGMVKGANLSFMWSMPIMLLGGGSPPAKELPANDFDIEAMFCRAGWGVGGGCKGVGCKNGGEGRWDQQQVSR